MVLVLWRVTPVVFLLQREVILKLIKEGTSREDVQIESAVPVHHLSSVVFAFCKRTDLLHFVLTVIYSFAIIFLKLVFASLHKHRLK